MEKTEQAAGTKEKKTAAPEDKISPAVDAWFARHIHNSPASRDEQVYKHLYQAREALKQELKEALTDV